MGRFILFEFDQYYPGGGSGDVRAPDVRGELVLQWKAGSNKGGSWPDTYRYDVTQGPPTIFESIDEARAAWQAGRTHDTGWPRFDVDNSERHTYEIGEVLNLDTLEWTTL